jgi:hypothetical protein
MNIYVHEHQGRKKGEPLEFIAANGVSTTVAGSLFIRRDSDGLFARSGVLLDG